MLSNPISAGARALSPPPVFLSLAAQSGLISFAGGVPDPKLFPFEQVSHASRRILDDRNLAKQALQYGAGAGYEPLREWLASFMTDQGAPSDPCDIVVTNGGLEALDLAAKMLIGPRDTIAVVSPTFFAALETFKPYRPGLLAIPFENGRLDMEAARRAVMQRPKFLYINPDFQNPTGMSVPLDQRRELIRLCAAEGVTIVEDGTYSQLSFDGRVPPSLLQLSREMGALGGAAVIYISTFSKTVAPGLRVGWACLPASMRAAFTGLKAVSTINTSQLSQMIVHECVRGGFEDQLGRLRSVYASRCKAMTSALAELMPAGVTWSRPEGGIFVWLEVPAPAAPGLFEKYVQEAGVAVLPGALAAVAGGCSNACRLSFATVGKDRIREGVARLAGALEAATPAGEAAGGV